MQATYTQEELDAAFADMDHLLSTERPVPGNDYHKCIACGDSSLGTDTPGGPAVCRACGVVQPGIWFGQDWDAELLATRCGSNYKRIHHWHERISQLLLMESPIPDEEFIQIAARLCDGTHTVINKDVIRSVLRSLKMQLYIEKWLQIIYRITTIMPPVPGSALIKQLDDLFLELQRPFELHRQAGRKNFLNYNYVFCRLFQKIGCNQFCMFFPLIKSKQKLKNLDDMWTSMVGSINWPQTLLQQVPPFAVRLERAQIVRLQQDVQDVLACRAVPRKVPLQMGFHKSDRSRRTAERDTREIKRLRLDQPGPRLRIPGWAWATLNPDVA